MREHWIAGVKPLAQFMEDGSFLMPEIPALLRALPAMGAPAAFDYDYLLSLSGMAVRLVWQQGWAEYRDTPNQGVFYGKNVVELALDRVGAGYTVRRFDNGAAEEVRRLLDSGRPVLMQGGAQAYAALLGYRGNDFYGVSTFADASQRIAPHAYNRIDCEKAERYIAIDGCAFRPLDRTLLTEVLQTAVSLARVTRSPELGDTALGISAFDAVAELMVWDEGFAGLTPGTPSAGPFSFPYERPDGYYRTDGAGTLEQRFWAGYCDFLCMLNGYENFARFLEKYAPLVPAWERALRAAAENYRAAGVSSGALWEYVKPDGSDLSKFLDRDVRYAFAAHMLRAKIYTIRAAECLEGILR